MLPARTARDMARVWMDECVFSYSRTLVLSHSRLLQPIPIELETGEAREEEERVPAAFPDVHEPTKGTAGLVLW